MADIRKSEVPFESMRPFIHLWNVIYHFRYQMITRKES